MRNPVYNASASTLTITSKEHANKIINLNRAAGVTVTLPIATGSGDKYTFIVGTAPTSNAHTLNFSTNGNTIEGAAVGISDDDASPDVSGQGIMYSWNAETNDDTITMSGTTTGGKLGDRVEVEDYGALKYHVYGYLLQSGTEATPFSAA